MKNYPYGSQSDKDSKDIVIAVKLFDNCSSIKWWLTEYDPQSKIAFGYVTGFYQDEWWTVSLEELESLTVPMMIMGNSHSIQRVEVDRFFTPIKFPYLPSNE